MRPLEVARAYGALLTLMYASAGCSLTADLDSLTSGGSSPEAAETTDGGSEAPNGKDGGCSANGCGATPVTPNQTPNTSNDTPDDATDPALQSADAGTTAETATFLDANSTSNASVGASANAELPSSHSDTTSPQAQTSESETSEPGGVQSCEGAGCGGSATVIHRYSFTNAATSIADSVGDADGTVVGVATESTGSFVFDGDTYIELPTEVLDGRENVTLEVWFTSYDTRNWERVFDVGESDDGSGKSYLFFTAQTPSANGTMRVTFRAEGEAEVIINSAEPAEDDVATHVAVVFDGSENQIRLYHDGELSASATTQGSLQDVNIANVWLGRSLFDSDPRFRGEIDEFRIYDGVLSDTRVKANFAAGPDALAP